jgi:hypothetical protein
VFQKANQQNLENFRQREDHQFVFQSSSDWRSLKLWNRSWGPLVSRSHCLTSCASRQRARMTPLVVTWWWPYTAGRRRPMWAQPYPVARVCSGEVLFHSLLLALALTLCFHYHLCSCSAPRRSTRRGQPPLSRLRVVQPGQRERHDAVHLLHRVLARSPLTEAEQPRFSCRRLPPWGAHRWPPPSKHI